MSRQEDFLSFITAPHLYLAAAVFAVCMLVLIALIYITQYRKKLLAANRDRINTQLNSWIGEAMVEGNAVIVRLTPRLMKFLKRPIHRQYITDSLINVRKNISGTAADNITALYDQLDLRTDSMKKLSSLSPHLKAKGIFELYMMGHAEAMPEIAKYTDSANEQVRMEAQTAMIGFKGFAGLTFLNTLTSPINDWQQLKMLDQLHKLDPGDMEDIPLWLSSPNDTVVIFALKLAEIYQQMEVHGSVVSCLASPGEKVRYHAIKTLGRIANAYTPGILRERYFFETPGNKKLILRQLCSLGGTADIDFLQEQLTAEDDELKLEASRAIARCSPQGIALLLPLAEGNAVLTSILKQVKYELEA